MRVYSPCFAAGASTVSVIVISLTITVNNMAREEQHKTDSLNLIMALADIFKIQSSKLARSNRFRFWLFVFLLIDGN
jgi:hypothetical protein